MLPAALEASRRGSATDEERTNTSRRVHENKVGDFVYKHVPVRSKLEPRWSGPYKVAEVSGSKNKLMLEDDARIIEANLKQIRPL